MYRAKIKPWKSAEWQPTLQEKLNQEKLRGRDGHFAIDVLHSDARRGDVEHALETKVFLLTVTVLSLILFKAL